MTSAVSSDDPRNLFVTKIPAEAKFSEVLSAFEHFGAVTSLKFVSEKNGPRTDRAFLTYSDAASGTSCLSCCRPSKSTVADRMLPHPGIVIQGEPVIVLVQKPRAELLSRLEVKDKRNLHLMYEGHITADMPAAQGLSAAELQKRKRLWERKQDKLADTNNKVSRTRLAVFNLPATAGTGQFRKIFAVAPKKYARTHKKETISKEIQTKAVRITEVRKN
jgi:nucleolar protein 4